MVFKELQLPFPFYTSLRMQNRFGENTRALLSYALITPKDAFLPFQFYVAPQGRRPDSIVAVRVCDDQEFPNPFPPQTLRVDLRAGREYYTYLGPEIAGGTLPLGQYYFRISWDGTPGVTMYSEVFDIRDFSIYDPEAPYTKVQWWNGCDIPPILYNIPGNDGQPLFRPTAWLDTFISESAPTFEAEGTTDGEGNIIPTSQRATVPFRIADLMPDFLTRAFWVAQMHDFIFVQDKGGRRSGMAENVRIENTPIEDGAYYQMAMLFSDVLLYRDACCDNMPNDCEGGAPPVVTDVYSVPNGENYVINVTIPTGTTSVYLYKSKTPTSTPVLVLPDPVEVIGGQIQVLIELLDLYDYVFFRGEGYGCDFGFSNRWKIPNTCEGNLVTMISHGPDPEEPYYNIDGTCNKGDTLSVYARFSIGNAFVKQYEEVNQPGTTYRLRPNKGAMMAQMDFFVRSGTAICSYGQTPNTAVTKCFGNKSTVDFVQNIEGVVNIGGSCNNGDHLICEIAASPAGPWTVIYDEVQTSTVWGTFTTPLIISEKPYVRAKTTNGLCDYGYSNVAHFPTA